MRVNSESVMNFSDFYRAVTGFSPFLWQSRLADDMVSGSWPNQLALPTSTGKSSLVVIWAYALGAELLRTGHCRHTPLRLIYVVDRRIIVDSIDQQAQQLALCLRTSRDPLIQQMAEALRPYSGAPAIHVSRARGGVPHKTLWTPAPNQPTILTSTVDQVGSRLLFRGYGISPKQRSIHAGLLGVDTLFVVDEAHLSTPFVQTLLAVQKGQQSREVSIDLRPLTIITMSATLSESDTLHRFTLNATEMAELAPRLQRPKRMTLATPSNMDNKTFFQNQKEICKNIQTEAMHLTKDLESGIGAIVVNHVATARAIFTQLQNLAEGDHATPGTIRDVVLLTGRIRPWDRDVLLDRWLPHMQAQRSKTTAPGVSWIVATQTIEVGADFDFDALITECAPLSALRQRLGRLNRLGARDQGTGVIARPERAPGIYSDDALWATWQWLTHLGWTENPYGNLPESSLPTSGSCDSPPFTFSMVTNTQPDHVPVKPSLTAKSHDDIIVIDGSSSALDWAIAQSPPIGVDDVSLDAPILTLPHVESWSQTQPAPMIEPAIAPFLHGKQNRPADVHVIWRRDLTENLLRRASQDLVPTVQIADFLAWVSPTNAESLDVPVWMVQEWLDGVAVQPFLADFDSTAVDAPDPVLKKGAEHQKQRLAWHWDRQCTVIPTEIRPGDTILVPSEYGGTDDWGLNFDNRDVVDVGDYTASGRRHVRLTSALIEAGIIPGADADVSWKPTLADLIALTAPDADASRTDFRDALDQWIPLVMPLVVPTLQAVLQDCRDHLRETTWYPYPETLGTGVVVLWYATSTQDTLDVSDETGDDATNCWGDRPGISLPTLQAHQEAVAAWIAAYTVQGLLPDPLAELVRLSGKYHDLGKLDPRFQVMMHGGDVAATEAATELVAKSNIDPRDRQAIVRAQRLAEYPRGQRHEELSVQLLRSSSALDGMDESALPLLSHLIGAHHGWGRPWFPIPPDVHPVRIEAVYQDIPLSAESTPTLGRLDSGWLDQFEYLQSRYGFWGLAYLESIMRLADYQASATNGGPR